MKKFGSKIIAFMAAVSFAAAPLGDTAAFPFTTPDTAISASAAAVKVKVTLDPNGGSCDTASITAAYNKKIGTLPTPVRNGYTFQGWYNGDKLYTETTKITTKNNFTLKASWKKLKLTCKLTFDPCGGSVSKKSMTYKSGNIVGALPVARKSGYTFMGWYTKKKGGKRINYSTKLSNVKNRTFYAHWAVPTFNTLKYKFENTAEGFGYSGGYVIPKERYRYIYDSFTADVVYDLYGRSWTGNCFGISASSALFNMGSIKPQSFNSKYYFPKSLSLGDKNKKLGLTLLQYIEAMQVIQYSDRVQGSINNHISNYSGLISRVKKCMKGKGTPVPVCVYDSKTNRGHALLAYKWKKESVNAERIYIYDSNYPKNSDAYITLRKQNGQYKSFFMDYSNKSFNTISWIDMSDVWYVWTRRTQENLFALTSTLAVGSQNAGVYSEDGQLCARIENGEFTPYAEGFDTVHSMDLDNYGEVVFTAPDGDYTIVAEDCALDVKLFGNGGFYKVESDSESIKFAVSRNCIELTASEGDSYDITVSDPYGDSVVQGVAEEDQLIIVCSDGTENIVPIEDEEDGESIEQPPTESDTDTNTGDNSSDEQPAAPDTETDTNASSESPDEYTLFDEDEETEEIISDGLTIGELDDPPTDGEV